LRALSTAAKLVGPAAVAGRQGRMVVAAQAGESLRRLVDGVEQ
jgi:hypothetical protein